MLQPLQNGGRVNVYHIALNGILHYLRLRLSGHEDDGHGLGIVGNGFKPDGYGEPITRYLYSAQVGGCHGLRFEVGLG